MRQEEVSLELIAISVEKELNWTIIHTQLNDVLISFCSRVIQPGQVFKLSVRKGDYFIFEKEVRLLGINLIYMFYLKF